MMATSMSDTSDQYESLLAKLARLENVNAELQDEICDGCKWMEALVLDSTDPGTGALAWLERNRSI